MPVSDVVLTHDDGAVRRLTLNLPEKRNAIDLELRVVLAAALRAAAADPGVRAIVLNGAGEHFCGGGDIGSMARMPAEGARPRVAAMQDLARAVLTCPTPVVAAVEGAAAGAGLALAAACDRVVAAADARFHAAFPKVGLAGDNGIFWSLPRRVGIARARQLLLFAETLDAAEAHRIGLVDAVVEPGGALEAAQADARRLAEAPPGALAAIKALIHRLPADAETVLAAELDAQTALFDSDDFAEGVAAFRERRTPVFGRHVPPAG